MEEMHLIPIINIILSSKYFLVLIQDLIMNQNSLRNLSTT